MLSCIRPPQRTESYGQGDLRPGPARGARWRAGSTKRSPAATSGPRHRRLSGAARLAFSPRPSSSLEDRRQRRRGAHPGAARAVVVGVVQEEDVAGRGRRRVARRAIDSGVARRVQSLPHCDQSTGRQPRPPHRPQAGGAEDPVGRPVVGDRLAGRLLDRRPAALGVVEQLPRRKPQLVAVAVAVQLDPVAGGDDLRRQRRPPHDLLAGEEEGRRGAGLAQSLEHARGALRVRAVVEGDRDARRLRPGAARSRAPRPGPARPAPAPAPRGRPPAAPRPAAEQARDQGARAGVCCARLAARRRLGRRRRRGRRVVVLADVDAALERLGDHPVRGLAVDRRRASSRRRSRPG